MALILEGKTLCPICGNPIRTAAEATAFPAFLRPGHRFARFSDAAFHTSCFVSCPERQDVEAVFMKYEEIWKSRPAHLKSLSEIEAWGKEAFREF